MLLHRRIFKRQSWTRSSGWAAPATTSRTRSAWRGSIEDGSAAGSDQATLFVVPAKGEDEVIFGKVLSYYISRLRHVSVE